MSPSEEVIKSNVLGLYFRKYGIRSTLLIMFNFSDRNLVTETDGRGILEEF